MDRSQKPPAPQPKVLKRRAPPYDIIFHNPAVEESLQMPQPPKPHSYITFNRAKFVGLPQLELELEEEVLPAKSRKVRAFPNCGVQRSTLLDIQTAALNEIKCDWGVK